jgi:GH15 family glucan-1,4-alpha-glucosidase
MALPIEDYALIGDCQTAALVGKDGSIDWLCFPRFDSPACFAALLGTPENGRWKLAPAGEVKQTTRRYVGDTLVLETVFTTADGEVAVTDFMPNRGVAPDVVRIVEGRRGSVAMHSELVIRFDYGSTIPWVESDNGGITAVAGPNALHLRTPAETHGKNMTTVSKFTVKEGDRVPFVMTWHQSYEPTPEAVDPPQALADTLEWWRDWSGRCTYGGVARDLVMRSLITLKALTYAPSGGIAAAATTSLPEFLGGVRNWDYRYCWLRDATLTLLSFLNAGYVEEARAWRQWLLRAVAGDPSKVQIMYGLGGERRLDEYEVTWLSGYEDSKPVRVGNGAAKQFQLDVFGEVADALHQARVGGIQAAPAGWALEKAFLREVTNDWQKPDEGIWEVRGPKRDFVHSKVMAWVAVDRAIRSAEAFGLEGPLDEWRALRQEIHDTVCEKGFDTELNSFTQYYGAKQLDASLLMIPLVGFLPADDPRVKGTVEAVEKHLLRDGFLLRYKTSGGGDGLPPGEGAFLACTFWLADCYALMGERDKARKIFERLAGLTNDVGLLSEEYDPKHKRLVGNFPQAFSHIGLINTAYALSRPDDGPAKQRSEA